LAEFLGIFIPLLLLLWVVMHYSGYGAKGFHSYVRRDDQDVRWQAGHALRKFRTATICANNYVDPKIIKSDITLLEVIKAMCPKIKSLFTISSHDALFTMISIVNPAYMQAIWDEYMKLDGNYHVIIYGIIEYIISDSDPTSHNAKKYLLMMTTNTAARAECLSHQDAALA
jgi:hypothetical protein